MVYNKFFKAEVMILIIDKVEFEPRKQGYFIKLKGTIGKNQLQEKNCKKHKYMEAKQCATK